MGLDEFADLLHGLETELPEPFGGLSTDPFFDAGLICPLPRADMPAIAPRGTPADPFRFEQYHVIAFLPKMQRGGEAGIATTDDAHVCLFVAVQRRQRTH